MTIGVSRLQTLWSKKRGKLLTCSVQKTISDLQAEMACVLQSFHVLRIQLGGCSKCAYLGGPLFVLDGAR
jgi:hypothetical protein